MRAKPSYLLREWGLTVGAMSYYAAGLWSAQSNQFDGTPMEWACLGLAAALIVLGVEILLKWRRQAVEEEVARVLR